MLPYRGRLFEYNLPRCLLAAVFSDRSGSFFGELRSAPGWMCTHVQESVVVVVTSISIFHCWSHTRIRELKRDVRCPLLFLRSHQRAVCIDSVFRPTGDAFR